MEENHDSRWLEGDRLATADSGRPLNLPPFFNPDETLSRAAWEKRRETLRHQWLELLGERTEAETPGTPRLIDRFEREDHNGGVYRIPTFGGAEAEAVLLEPRNADGRATPGAIVPFYHPDPMCGFDLKTKTPIADRAVVQFGLHLVRQGYKVVCVEAFPFNTVPEPRNNAGFAWWQMAADALLAKNPRWTGSGRLIDDTRKAVDFLLSRPGVDAERVVIIGHSLGGKMAFMTAAADPRIKAVIGSDFGMGWDFTNWDAPWYYGQRIKNATLDNRAVLALIAPRPFLLIAGEADRPESLQYLNAARSVYALYGAADNVACYLHGTGHQPTEDSVATAYRWLAKKFAPGGPRTFA